MEISLTDFVEFTIKSGPSKVTVVRSIKHRNLYEPAVDFWKPLRQGIVELHKNGNVDKAGLESIVAAQTDLRKQRLYPIAISGYLKFLGKKLPNWMTAPRGLWSAGVLDVRVNPEIALRINSRPTVIKLYFKADELTKPRVQASIGVMAAELGSSAAAGTQFGVLDVRAGRLLLVDGRWAPADTQILIRGEALAFAKMWDEV